MVWLTEEETGIVIEALEFYMEDRDEMIKGSLDDEEKLNMQNAYDEGKKLWQRLLLSYREE